MLGIALGLGAMTKFSVAFLMLGVAVAVILSPLRQELRTRWPWIAVATAAVMAIPAIAGQLAWDWPFLAQMSALRQSQLERVTPGAFCPRSH